MRRLRNQPRPTRFHYSLALALTAPHSLTHTRTPPHRAAEAADQQVVIDQLTAHITDAEQKIENQKRAALVAEATAKEDMEMKEKELKKIKKLKKQAKTQDMLIIEGLRENLAQAKDDFVQAKDEAVARVTEVREVSHREAAFHCYTILTRRFFLRRTGRAA